MWLMLSSSFAFEELRMLILVKHLSPRRQLAALLSFGGRLYIPGRYGQPNPTNIVIDTPSGLAWRACTDFGVICAYDSELLTTDTLFHRVFEYLNPMPLRIAFGPPQQRLTHADEMRIEATFGPLVDPNEIHPVRVIQLQLAPSAKARYRDPLERKVANYWENDARNQFVASIGLALAARGLRALTPLGIEADEPHQSATGLRACLLVEAAPHARQLTAAMYAAAREVTEASSSVHLHDRGRTTQIVTLPSAAQATRGFDVLVLADGGQDRWPCNVDVSPAGGNGALVIIDVADAFDAQARRAAEGRRKDYLRRGWPCETISCGSSEAARRRLVLNDSVTSNG